MKDEIIERKMIKHLFTYLILILFLRTLSSFRIDKASRNLLNREQSTSGLALPKNQLDKSNLNLLNQLNKNELDYSNNLSITTLNSLIDLTTTNATTGKPVFKLDLKNSEFCRLNCTCILLNENRIHNDSELNLINNCLHLNLSLTENENEFKIFNYYHTFQLKNLKEVSLIYNNLTKLNENLISNSKHDQPVVERLSLSFNQLTKFPKIKYATNSFKQLNLDHNRISVLNSTRNDLFRNLEYLNLNHNRIRLIKKPFIRQICNELKYFDLSFNKLTRLDDNLFASCTRLETLKLNRNRLADFGLHAFDNLTNLVELDLSRNNLTNLTVSFRSLTNLRILNLSKNNLRSLDDSVFQHLMNLRTLNLNENNLVRLDSNFVKGLKNLKLLQLSNNQLEHIAVNWLDSKNLLNLYLEHNRIEKLNSTTFSGLINLEKLYLGKWRLMEMLNIGSSHTIVLQSVRVFYASKLFINILFLFILDYNLISAIEKNVFQTNTNLIWLFLNDNYLNKLVEQNRTLFVHNRLQHLSLENNHIKYIPNQLFNNLTSLITIDLGLNEIKYIEENALIKLNKLDELNWDSRSLECSCRLKWFANYYQEKSIENIYLEHLECRTPSNLENKKFIDVNVNLFLCKDDFKHYFVKEPKRSQTIKKGKSFFLKCKVATNSFLNEDIIFEWKKNNQTLSLSNERNIVEIMYLDKDKDFSINHKLIYSSHLHFLNASVQDEGDYVCMANNTYGSIESKTAKVLISKPPQFVSALNLESTVNSKPNDLDLEAIENNYTITSSDKDIKSLIRNSHREADKDHLKIRLGKDIVIDSRVEGSPPPRISLHKTGQDNFTSTLKYRIHFDNVKQQFIIKNAQIYDQGVWQLSAINELGSSTKNITVDILSPPYFSTKQHNQLDIITSFRHVEISTTNQLTINYLYENWYLILVLIVLIVFSICLFKIIYILIFKKLRNRFASSKKPKYLNKKTLNNHQMELNNKLNELNKVINNDQLEQNENLLLNKQRNDLRLDRKNFAHKFSFKKDFDTNTRLVSFKKVDNSLDNLTNNLNNNLNNNFSNTKVPVKKVQFNLV